MPYETIRQFQPIQQGEQPVEGLSLGPASVSLDHIWYGDHYHRYALIWASDLPYIRSGRQSYRQRHEALDDYRELRGLILRGIAERAEEQIDGLSLGLPGGATEEEVAEKVEDLLGVTINLSSEDGS